MLDAIVSGSLRTQERLHKGNFKQHSCDEVEPLECQFCARREAEAFPHMWWRCPTWESARAPFLQRISQIWPLTGWPSRFSSDTPCCLLNCGVAPALPDDSRRYLTLPPYDLPTPPHPPPPARPDELWINGRLQVYTDWACSDQADLDLWRARFGVYYGPAHTYKTKQPHATFHQNSERAELRAILWAVDWAWCPIDIYLDNEWVATTAAKVVAGWLPPPKYPHHDLWVRRINSAARAWAANGPDAIDIEWINGHTTLADVDAGVTTLTHHVRNEGADACARAGARQHAIPGSWRTTLAAQRTATILIQRMMLEIANLCFEARDLQLLDEAHPSVLEDPHEAPRGPTKRAAASNSEQHVSEGPTNTFALTAFACRWPSYPWNPAWAGGWHWWPTPPSDTRPHHKDASKRWQYPVQWIDLLHWYWTHAVRWPTPQDLPDNASWDDQAGITCIELALHYETLT